MDFNPASPPKPGDVLTARRLAAIEAELKRLATVRGGAGLVARQGSGGLQLTAVQPNTRYLAITTSNFAPRSGATVSSGSVDLVWMKAPGTLDTTGDSIDEVWCASANTMSSGHTIDSGMYVVVWQDPFGAWWASPEECA